MSNKRAFSEVNDAESSGPYQHPDRRFPRKQHTHTKRQKTDGDNINWVKKRARNIERLLQKKNEAASSLPANKRVELERELAAHRQRISAHRDHKDRSKMISKYHMVRFFERQKASRLVKKLRKKLAQTTDTEEADTIRKDLHVAEVDEDYTRYCPLMERYVSLYATAKKDGEEEETKEEGAEETPDNGKASTGNLFALLRAERPPMWKVVEETREAGPTALQRLRDSRSKETSSPVSSAPAKPAKVKTVKQVEPEKSTSAGPAKKIPDREQKNRRERRAAAKAGAEAAAKAEDNSDSDGGFFE